MNGRRRSEPPPPTVNRRRKKSAMDRKIRQSPELSRIDQLPDDVLLLILSFLPILAHIARTSILSRRWRNIWHNVPYLNFDAFTLPGELSAENYYRYITWVNQVVSIPRLSLVKGLRICHRFDILDGLHIKSWIDFAIANRVETLQLDFRRNSFYQLYKLPEECWYRASSGLSSLNCLKSLVLSSVSVSKQFVEFILSSCPLLEELSLLDAGKFFNLDISGLRLRQLRFENVEGSALLKLYAPRLTSFVFISIWGGFNPRNIDAPMLTDLTIGGNFGSQPVMSYLKQFVRYLPQLEKLDLIIAENKSFKFKQIPELLKLKYLKICFEPDTDPIFHRIIKFLNAFPVLETFVFEMPSLHTIPLPWAARVNLIRKIRGDFICDKSIMCRKQERLRLKAERSCPRFECLKVLELVGGEGILIDEEVVKFIISKTPNLKKVMIKIGLVSPRSESEIMEAVKAKAIELCPARVEIVVVA